MKTLCIENEKKAEMTASRTIRDENMRTLILIPCCKFKENGGTKIYNHNNSILNYLDNINRDRLLHLRQEIMRDFFFEPGQDFGFQDSSDIKYLGAYQRYKGHIYQRISQNSLDKLKRLQDVDLVIISALYGIVRFDESIRYYDTTMNNKVQGKNLKRWWKYQNLSAILNNYIIQNNISHVHVVLSNDYMEALGESFSNLNINCEYHKEFSKYNSGSNFHRGDWLENFVQSFEN